MKHTTLALTACLLGPAGANAASISIQHAAADCLLVNTFPKVMARLSPTGSVASARVFFRAGEGADWCSVDMKSDAPSFSAVLPRAQGERLEYYIQVVDHGAGETRTDPFVTRVVADRGACAGGVVAYTVAKASVPSCGGRKPNGVPSAPLVRTASAETTPETRPETKTAGQVKAPEVKPLEVKAAKATPARKPAVVTSAPAAPAPAIADKPKPSPARVASVPIHVSSRDPLAIRQVDPGCLLSTGTPLFGAVLTPSDRIRTARVYFRRDEAAAWCHVDMRRAGEGWSGVLPRDAVAPGLQYYVWAADNSKKEARTPEFNAPDLALCSGAAAEDVLLQPAVIPVRCGDDPAGGGGKKAGLLLAGLGALGGGAFVARDAAAGPGDGAANPTPSTGGDGGRGGATSPTPTGGTPPPSGGSPTPPSGCGDSTPPITAITNPSNGQTISFIPTSVEASASDNISVARVDFFAIPHVLGNPVGPVQQIGTATSAPYRVSWTPSCVATYRLYSQAFDACGNSATSGEIEVFLEAGIAPPCVPDGAPTPTVPPTPQPTVPQPTAPPTPQPTVPPTPQPTVPPVGPLGRTGDVGSSSVAVTSELSMPAASGQVLLNGALAGSVNVGIVQFQSTVGGDDNRLEAWLVVPARQAGLWRFRLQGRRLTTVLAGEVVSQDGESIVFRLTGRAGERVAFGFR